MRVGRRVGSSRGLWAGVAAGSAALLVFGLGVAPTSAADGNGRTPLAAAGHDDAAAVAAMSLSTKVSHDPYTNTGPQHKTEAEPDTFAWGDRVVSVFQTARYSGGGSDNTGWATSSDGGVTWRHGFMPGITTVAGGPWARVSDPAIAYNAKYGLWIASGLVIDASGNPAGVVVNQSTNGRKWQKPVLAVGNDGREYDKEWIACDNSKESSYYGNCYIEVDHPDSGDQIVMSTSSDGGTTWSAAQAPAGNAFGLGGQPLVQPDGTVVVTYSADFSAIEAFTSTDGGASWGAPVLVTNTTDHEVTGMREEPMPSAEMDASGRLYVVWDDCRFESGCSANDIVMSTSKDGVNWSSVVRIPIDPKGSGVDHFTPGIGVDPTTKGSSAKLGLYYYFYPDAACAYADCRLKVGYVSSTDGGQTWSAPTSLAKPMQLAWLAQAGGAMVGDYISCSVLNGTAVSVYAIGHKPNGSTKRQPMATAGPLVVTGGSRPASAAGVVVRPGQQRIQQRGVTAF